MPYLTLDKVTPGMVVRENVENDKGMVLLPEGATLNEELIARLKKWSVNGVDVNSDAETGSDRKTMAPPVMDAELEKRLQEKFQPVLDDPIMADIYKAVKTYFQDESTEEAS
jgi:hypothetical protein